MLALIVLLLFSGACSTHREGRYPANDRPSCQLVYDAGSSGTRLYVFEQSASGWVRHHGPRTSALADPVRGVRGKTLSDTDTVVDEIIDALEDMRSDGPVAKDGNPEWPAFDWRTRCRLDAAAVYATAGMRLAEQQDTAGSELLWSTLNSRLSAALGMAVTTRTISGYEEGLFAWLAIREGQDDGYFAVAEMGGASVQVTFPCLDCKSSRRVRVKGAVVPIYSHSFLGWGQDEALKNFGSLPVCARGVGKSYSSWQAADCAAATMVSSDTSDEINASVSRMDGMRWYRSGAFRYMRETDIDSFCREGIDSGFEPETSCFRAVYLQNVLKALGVPPGSEKSDVDWTLGAVVCTATSCLEDL